jgi:phage terminase small subunit
MANRKLTAQQEKFKNNILSGMNGKAAYIAAGYKATGAAAEVNASKLLRNTKVKAAIEEAQKKAAYKAEVTAERILREEMCLAFFDPGELVDKNGNQLPLHKLPGTVRRAIAGLEVITQPKGKLKFKYKFSDKGRSLDRLERIQGMFAPEKHEIAGKDGNAIDLTTIVLRVTEKNESGTSN